jgi:hypothetical protein
MIFKSEWSRTTESEQTQVLSSRKVKIGLRNGVSLCRDSLSEEVLRRGKPASLLSRASSS